MNTLRQPATARRVLCGALLVLAIVLLCAVPAAAQPRHMRILAPNGGEELAGSSLVTVRWSGTFAPTDTVAVEYSLDDGASWRLIRKVRGDTQVPWNVPFVNSTRCRVRATQVSGIWQSADSVAVFPASTKRGVNLTYSPDGTHIARYGSTTIDVIDTRSGKEIAFIKFDLATYDAPIWSANNRRIASVHYPPNIDNVQYIRIDVWDVLGAKRIMSVLAPRRRDLINRDLIKGVCFSSDGSKVLINATYSSTLWDVATSTVLDTLSPKSGKLCVGRFAPGDSLIYLTNENGSLMVWSVPQHAFVQTMKMDAIDAPRGWFSADCSKFVATNSIGDKQRFTVYDTRDSSRTVLFQYPTIFYGTACSNLQYLIGRGNKDTVISVYDLMHPSKIYPIRNLPGPITSFTVLPVGERFATVMNSDYRIIEWRFDNTDSSDAAFTISSSGTQLPRLVIAPTPVGRLRDTTITAYITNSGGTAMNVDSLRISAGDTADFALTSGGGAFSLAPGASRALGIRFTPSRAGERTAWIELRAGGQTSVGELAGIGTRGRLLPLFDTMLIGTTKPDVPLERTVKLLWNGGDGPLRLDSVQLYGSSAYLFSVLDSGGVPKDLPPGDTFSIRVGFKWRNPSLHWCSVITYGDSGTTGFSLSRIFVRVEDAADAPNVEAGSSGAIAGLSWRIRGLSPVPADEHLRAELRVLRPSRIGLRIVDAVGHVVLEREPEERAEGLWAVDLRVAALPPGAYLLQAVGDGGSETVRFVVVR